VLSIFPNPFSQGQLTKWQLQLSKWQLSKWQLPKRQNFTKVRIDLLRCRSMQAAMGGSAAASGLIAPVIFFMMLNPENRACLFCSVRWVVSGSSIYPLQIIKNKYFKNIFLIK